jgi:hypothetical protein
MLLCPKCQDSNWTVNNVGSENIVRCVSLVADEYVQTLPIETFVTPMIECGVEFPLPIWAHFPPTAKRNSCLGVDGLP